MVREAEDPENQRLFWEKVHKTEKCWKWKGRKNDDGYGRFQKGSAWIVFAHRFSYAMNSGKITDQSVLHTCDNPACVNPDHLYQGTQKQNMLDMRKRRREVKAIKYSNEIVESAISMRRDGFTYKEIREKYGIARGTLRGIIKGVNRSKPVNHVLKPCRSNP